MLGTVALLATGLAMAAGCDTSVATVQTACAYHGVVVTSWSLAVTVNCSNCDMVVNKDEFVDQPSVRFVMAKPDAIYTLVMVDPDPPEHAEDEYWLHWVVSNLVGSAFQTGDLDEATIVAEYNKPEPPPDTGAHRYMFLVYEQNTPQVDLSAPAERSHFRLAPWLEEQATLCGPVGGMQFRAPY